MPVTIVTAERPGKIVAYAARELREYLDRLFIADEKETLIHIHTLSDIPPPVRIALGGRAPALSDQGFLIRRLGESDLLLLGGSGTAALWAVYELAELWGVVHTLHEDVFPAGRTAPWLPDIDRAYEPRQKYRSWRVMNTLLHGPEGWTLRQHRRFILQLARQKYNGVLISIWPQQPFVDFRIGGIEKQSGCLHFGVEFPVDGMTVGRERMAGMAVFTNPEFAGCGSWREFYERGRAYIAEIISYAKSFGMRVEMAINIFDLPREFAPLLEKPSDVKQVGTLTVAETGDIFGKNHIGILNQVFETYADTYPDVDIFELNLPEHARNTLGFGEAWASLGRRFGLSGRYDIAALLSDPVWSHVPYGGPQRSEDEGRMTLVMLETLHRLFDATEILKLTESRGKRLAVQAGLSCAGILPVMSEAMWPGAYLNVCLGYTASRSVRCLRAAEALDTARVAVEQIVTLQDDNIGPMPQVAARSIERLVDFGSEHGWSGYLTRFWPIGDLGPVSHFLSKASWERTDAQRAYAGYFTALCGERAAAPMRAAMNLLEDATVLTDFGHLCFLFPAPGIMSGSVGRGKKALLDDCFWQIRALYDEAHGILSKLAGDAGGGDGCGEIRYWAARAEFARSVLEGMHALELGNGALESGDADGAEARYRDALARFEAGLRALEPNVRDDSDVAVLAIYSHLLLRETKQKIDEALQGARE